MVDASALGGTGPSTFEQDLARLDGKVTVLESALAKPEGRPNFSLYISIAAFIFSMGTTAVSYYRTQQQDIHDARAELRSLIQRMDHLPVDNIENLKKYKDDFETARQLSGLLNTENSLIAKQAYDVINRIPNNVGSSEYLNVGNALVQSGLTDKALKLYQSGLKVSSDANDETNLLRAYAFILFYTGDLEAGRTQYRSALAIFGKYPTSNCFLVESTHFLTEVAWSENEAAARQCSYAKAHLEQAQLHVAAMTPGPGTTQYQDQLEKEKQKISACIP